MAAGRPRKRAKRPQEFTQHSQPWNYGVKVSKSDQPGSSLQSGSAPPLIKRPRFDVYQESLSSCGPNEVPSKLHPEKERQNKEKFFVGSPTCTSCNLKESEQATFSEKCQGQTRRGPVTGNLNEMLALPCYKTKVGVTDLRFIISCLNILPPSSGYLYKKLNKLSSTIISDNECVLVENQKFVQEVNMLTYKGIHVQTDTAYNHRPQSGGESATQSVAIVMEHTTSRKLPLCVSIANKLCSKKTCIHLNCKKNHRTEDSMSSTETKLAKENLNKLEMLNILKIDSLTCHASAQLEKTVREHLAKVQRPTRQYTCYVHAMRTLQKHVRNVNLTGPFPSKDKHLFQQKLATAIRRRVHFELVRIQRLFSSEEVFLAKAKAAVQNIIQCFSNEHGNCRKHSLVCLAHLASYSSKFLPYAKHLNLCSEDTEKLESVLRNFVSDVKLSKISCLLNTNKCESLHSRIFTYASKTSVWSRNFDALCHSALHSSVFGTGKSTLILAESRGIVCNQSEPVFQHMVEQDQRTAKDRERKSSLPYKYTRYIKRKQKCNRTHIQNSVFANSVNNFVTNEHSYTLNPLN
ncbi:hypothetical protein CHS0354_004630 [Potamilus streckersoni]|uniref:Mutator-like transposase domain-containing protein n=1 Tax=Potamilus streckersoni TaxID=2493646 RepID=A0AAE0S516_9BIVA|nr:hypothetical protein CHS0354_004630 [Potamilus streckersoni]